MDKHVETLHPNEAAIREFIRGEKNSLGDKWDRAFIGTLFGDMMESLAKEKAAESARAEAAEQRVREVDEILLHVLPLVRIAMWNDTVRRIAALGITGSGSADNG